MKRIALQFVFVLVFAGPLTAQVPSGAVAGTVTDQNGGVLANATVTVTNKATGLSRVVQSGRGRHLLRPVAACRPVRRPHRGAGLSGRRPAPLTW